MELAAALSALIGCQVDISVVPTADYWSKLVENFVKKNRPELSLTISNMKSFTHFTGRLVASYVYNESDLQQNFNTLGACIWVHHWDDEPRCFHGVKMVSKPITYNLTPNSDEANRALSSGEGKLEKGKIKLTNYGNIVCSEDVSVQWPVLHASTSCGMNFGNKDKAIAAFRHNIEWTAAMFPNANKTDIAEKMIIITQCFCNFGSIYVQLGRQLCKMTAFEIPGAADIDPDCADPIMAATQIYRHTFVFQCCNPANFRKINKTDNQKHCEFKLSMIDVRQAMKVSKDIWNLLRDNLPDIKAPCLHLPLFQYDPRKYSFKQAIVAQYAVETDTDAFC
ncbi:MAG: DNA-binding protein [psittacine adenovirus 7]|uniref:DNA-binding protein n=1 Tax=psittacine adenovirus 7 TaxID=2848040 RepID=A0A6B9LS34_9ADEN|nr:MAG: DNA-binding protein [psittacine adenovirus 7]QHB43558.1 MAG: DNA-binding protein [psittacine adenovirus 7]